MSIDVYKRQQENLAKNLVEVLYPNDNHYAGKELRLKPVSYTHLDLPCLWLFGKFM